MLTGGKPEKLFESCLRRLSVPGSRILDVGTSQRFAKELRPYEKLFEGTRYLAAGYEPSMAYGAYNCDCHQDIEMMSFEDGYFDAVICLEVLEHVADPFAAAREISRVLRPGGFLLLTVPFLTSYHGKGSQSHGHGSYPDYWRFTHEGLGKLFGEFRDREIQPLDGPVEYRLKQLYLSRFLGIGIVRAVLDALDRPVSGKATSRHLFFGVK